MDDVALKRLLEDLGEIERRAVKLRVGVITDTTPLSVALGGSAIAYTNVKALRGPTPLAVDDVVAVLVAANDLLVLGVISTGI
jgi:hypothetical protein